LDDLRRGRVRKWVAQPDPFIGIPIVPGVTGPGKGVTNPGNLRNVSSKEADKIAQDKGFKNAEDMKTQELGADRAGKHNIKVDKSTGQIVYARATRQWPQCAVRNVPQKVDEK